MRPREIYEQRLLQVRSELNGASLLLVSKTRSLEEIKAYYELGQRDFGENRIQELAEKSEALKSSCPDIRWHMIGHLQTNKINLLFKIHALRAVHSVHDRHLLEKMITAQDKLSHPLEVFLQFNTSKEAEKSGFETYTDLRTSAELLLKSKNLKLVGLMTMGTLRTDNFLEEAGRCFQELQVEKEKLQSELGVRLKTSMGMSQDYQIAVREGSDWVRLGTMMFE